jgi:hypothetical protein
MGLYRIWINPRGVGRHAVGREYPARPPYHVDIEARDLTAAKKQAAQSPYWTGEIQALRAGDARRTRARHGNAARVGAEHVSNTIRATAGAHKVTLREYTKTLAKQSAITLRHKTKQSWTYQIDSEPEQGRFKSMGEAGYAASAAIAQRGDRRRSHGNALTRKGYLREFKVTKIHLDRGGYDSRGRYYGVGQGLYRVSSEDGDVIVRADSAREARAEALRRPGYWGGWR